MKRITLLLILILFLFFSSSSSQAATVELDTDTNGAIDISKGGTNATTAGQALINLGLFNADTLGHIAEDSNHQPLWYGASWPGAGSGMTWPTGLAGVAFYNGLGGWGPNISIGTTAYNLVQLDAYGRLPAVPATNLTNFPIFNQNTTGTAAGFSTQYTDWNASSGGASIANKPTIPSLLSQLTGDSSNRTVTDTLIGAWSGKLDPTGSAAGLTNFPILNQNTTGTAANLSGTPALPNGTTATTQTQGNASTQLATTAYVDTGLGGKQATGAYLTGVTVNSPLSGAGTSGSHLTVDLSGKQDALPSQTGNTGKALTTNGTALSWGIFGDMLKSTYDPTGINASPFNVDNQFNGTSNKVYTAIEQAKLAGMGAGANVKGPSSISATGNIAKYGSDGYTLVDGPPIGIAIGNIPAMVNDGSGNAALPYTISFADLVDSGSTRFGWPSVAGQVPSFSTAGVLTWLTPPAGLSGGTQYYTPVWTSSTAQTGIAPGTAGWVYTSNGPSANPSFQATSGGGNVSNNGTPALHQWGVWYDSTHVKGVAVTASKPVCTDSNGEPVACTNLTDVAPATTIASGTSALGTGAITSGACASAVTTTATGAATTDVIQWGFNGDPTGVTGYAPTANGMLTIISYPTSGNVNFKVCNLTATSITPQAITLNWRVSR